MCGRSGKKCVDVIVHSLCLRCVCCRCAFGAHLSLCMRVALSLCAYASEDPRRDVIIEGLPAGFTQSMWPHRRWWKWIKDWGESCFKKAFRAPPFLNYPHNGLLILIPPSPHSELFISFLSPLHTSQSCPALYSYYPAPSYLTRSPSFCPSAVAKSIPFFLLVLHI